MKRICIGVIAIALMAAFVALGSAATKTYQFTGIVKTVDGVNFSV